MSATPEAKATSLVKLEEALEALRREAATTSLRELSISITKTEEALMWRERVNPLPQREAAPAPGTAPTP